MLRRYERQLLLNFNQSINHNTKWPVLRRYERQLLLNINQSINHNTKCGKWGSLGSLKINGNSAIL